MAIRCGAPAFVLLVVAFATALAPAPAAADEAVAYTPPVSAPVVDPFRPPRSAFGPGNRGLTYDLAGGTPVRASAPGEVVFAGPVGRTLHVTVLHADGLRTTYSFLAAVSVRRGQRVAAGEVVGVAGAGFHFGVRAGDAYLDPAALFGHVEIRVRLVAHEEPLPPTDAGLLRERIALQEVVRDRNLLERAVDWTVDTGTAAVERLGAGIHMFTELSPANIVSDSITTLITRWRTECTRDGAALPARPGADRIALLVAGHGSSSDEAAVDDVDTDALGYHDGDVLRYSYRGGRVPADGLAPDLAAIPAHGYGPEATHEDLVAEGRELADLVEEIARRRPGTPIDLLAHSQGGLVSRLAIEELERRGRLDALGAVVTMGTPHGGTDLSTGAILADTQDHQSLQWMADGFGAEVDTDSEAVLQMAETSELVVRLALDGVPDGVDFRTIGAAGDLVVTGEKTVVSGQPAAMVSLYGPSAHAALPGDDDTTHEISLALGGLAPSCRSVAEALGDALAPEVISFIENAAIAAWLI